MLKRIGNIIIAVWMSMLLLFGGISTALIHQFVNHKDGIEPDTKGLVFEKRHHHCAFLAFSLTPFTNNCQIPVVHCFDLRYSLVFYTITNHFIPHYEFHAFLRGPPLAV